MNVQWLIKADAVPQDNIPIGMVMPYVASPSAPQICEESVLTFIRLLAKTKSISEDLHSFLDPMGSFYESGWIACDGSYVNPDLYPQLAQCLKQLPDLRGKTR